ncbi:MAG: tRNA (adenosine(37)-N6)-threonylcarbamoyltransferase complex transferase subunit TsaD [Candidatus Paceibacterota bacterium]
MKILSIETSCDETAISIIEAKGEINSPSFEVLSDEIISQVNLHQEFGGVYPSLAKREHAKNLPIILEKTLKDADFFVSGKTEISKDEILKILEREPEMAENLWKIISCIEKPEIEYIAVTAGPGLEPALWVGITFAKALAHAWKIPLIPVNHMEGHILSFLLQDTENKISQKQIEFPALSLLISGGHTELILVKDWTKYEKIGQTVDDAVGEAFDKVARILGLPYPGGPEISKLAELGKENEKIKLPRPMIKTNDFNFSFSGLKTAVLYLVRDLGEISEQDKKDIAREFETAVGDVFVHKIKNAIKKYGVKELIIGGGVSANKYLRERLANDLDVEVLLPSKKLSTDNSIMIGIAGYFKIISNPKK